MVVIKEICKICSCCEPVTTTTLEENRKNDDDDHSNNDNDNDNSNKNSNCQIGAIRRIAYKIYNV